MGKFSKSTKGRAWIGTVHIANMEKSGLSKEEYENPELLADVFTKAWDNSGKGRSSGIAVCVSEKGCYHAHMALYGNLTTLGNVSKILFGSHIEPQLGGKKELKNYLLKNPPYNEKGEQVLYSEGLDNVQEVQGKRSDLDDIEELLNQGYSPSEIMEINFSYRKYEKMIKSAFIDKRIKETPLIKKMHNEWHVGDSGSGKTYYYYQLCEEHSPSEIYMATDFENGGFDFYIDQGAPPILFLDEFKGNMRYSQLLTTLDKYSRTQTHCRYANTYNLWTTCIITSIFPPDEVYASMVDNDKRDRDKIDQLLRRLDVIVYHYKANGEYKTYSMPASEYRNYEDLKRRVMGDKNGFSPVNNLADVPFNNSSYC
ncbi:hypothetical protein LAD12857_10800 [Lacrimispora amygdalina]|uniref:Helicase superfamily 3 single-stranded DNA/RNA virus domain-containing protein n=1 Tax=Lacrimispora amygdalina TaxID=253257 RepID=A0ABQ5M2Z5_9FIRM